VERLQKINSGHENNTRLLVLQAVLGDSDYQDIATIEIEKHNEEEISLQIIGDPDLYGADYILEPAISDSSAGGQGGGDAYYLALELLEELSAVVFVSATKPSPEKKLTWIYFFDSNSLYYDLLRNLG
jgi:hypothetical protein